MGPIKSLVELCMDTCQRHIGQLTSFGDAEFLMPRERVHDLLSKINNPSQLRTIEINSPHLQPETAEYWKRLIQKQFPVESKEKNYTPKNPTSWYKIYERYEVERRQSQKEAEERMRQQFQGLQQKKDTRVSHIVDQKFLPRPPKTGRNIGTGQRGSNYEKATGNLSFGKGTRTSNALQKARRQASEYKLVRRSLANPFRATPTGTVKAAPVGMIDAKRIAAQPAFRASSSLRRSGSGTSIPSRPSNPGMENASRPPQYISDSEEDDGDLFDEPSSSKDTPRASLNRPSTGSSSHVSKPVRRSGLLSSAPRPKPSVTRGANTTATGKPDNRPAPTSSNKSRQEEALENASEQYTKSRTRTASGSEPSSNARANSPPGAQSPPLMAKKRKAVDIFMPPKKRKN